MFFILIDLLVIGIVIQAVKYKKVRNKIFSHKEVEKAAREQVKKMKITNPVITCEYCGSQIDTSREKVCSHCGAPYDVSADWRARFNVSDSFIEESADEVISSQESKVKEETANMLKKIKRRIITLCVLVFGLLILGAIILVTDGTGNYRDNEKLNQKNGYRNCVDVDYKINGDGVIYDNGNVKITVAGIYYEENSTRRYNGLMRSNGKIAFTVENSYDENIYVSISCNSINGISSDTNYISMYGRFKKNKTVTIYEQIYQFPGEGISELYFDKIYVSCDNYKYGDETVEGIKLTTTHDETCEYDLDGYKMIYTNDKFDVYARYTDESYDEGYILYINNKSDKAFKVTTKDILVDDASCDIYGIRDLYIPSGYKLKTSTLYSTEDTFENLKSKEVKMSIAFNCKEDPSLDFSTGYIELN